MQGRVGDVHRNPARRIGPRIIGFGRQPDDSLGVDIGAQGLGGGHQAVDAAMPLAAVDQVGPVQVALNDHIVAVDRRRQVFHDSNPLAARTAHGLDDPERRSFRTLGEGQQGGPVGRQDEAFRKSPGRVDGLAGGQGGGQSRLVGVGRPLVEILGVVTRHQRRRNGKGFAAEALDQGPSRVVGGDRTTGVAQRGGQPLQRVGDLRTGRLAACEQALVGGDGLVQPAQPVRQQGGVSK